MSAITNTFNGTLPSTEATRPSALRRFFNAMIEARQRQAQRQVNGYLLEFDDATLESYGFKREELEKDAQTFRAY